MARSSLFGIVALAALVAACDPYRASPTAPPEDALHSGYSIGTSSDSTSTPEPEPCAPDEVCTETGYAIGTS